MDSKPIRHVPHHPTLPQRDGSFPAASARHHYRPIPAVLLHHAAGQGAPPRGGHVNTMSMSVPLHGAVVQGQGALVQGRDPILAASGDTASRQGDMTAAACQDAGPSCRRDRAVAHVQARC
eukprot:CAMPEP_0204290408 /NCGR_PEP_ID=MMETSP0468-20130131/60483_1 /ASSEMBLY_ACC=CAM_ASM_000383 /TAXON_ID=2969 /ORGANISM="Oxyrrhis marina" /LENGTH=120 /DNA_ID=CAMNT_0051268615 /DNA_START=17 /DNA_END=376 /DNA_ORIENTATION=+